MILAEFNPTILFFLLWGLLSWFSKKKKNQLKEKDQVEYSDREPKADLFARLQKLQDYFSTEAEIFPLAPDPIEVQQEDFPVDEENSFEESEFFVSNSSEVDTDEDCLFKTDIKIPIAKSNNWLKQSLSGKSNIRKVMVLKEALGEPRSIHPYTGDYYK